jgi:hypothetical protein
MNRMRKGLIFHDMSKLSFSINSATGSRWVNRHKTNVRITVRDVTSDFAMFEELPFKANTEKMPAFRTFLRSFRGHTGELPELVRYCTDGVTSIFSYKMICFVFFRKTFVSCLQVTREQNLIDKCLGSETITKERTAT